MTNISVPSRLLITGGAIGAGSVGSVLFTGDRIVAIGPDAERTATDGGVERLDLSGYVLLVAPCEPHAHLDKALLGERYRNPSGDLAGAISATRSAYPTMDTADVYDRARRSLEIALRRGYTAIRTHVNCEEGIDLEAIRALIRLREEVRDTLDLQVFAMAGYPVTGRDGTMNRRLLHEALDAGADGVGGAPWLDPHASSAVVLLVHAAAERHLMIDLHLDETLDPASLTVRTFASEVAAHGLGGRATASHCVSLGQQSTETARTIALELAAAGVAIVTLPQTNLYLQGREGTTFTPRGLPALSILREAGVAVAGGGDNWRDPFNPTSRIDAMETASLLVVAAHFSVADAYDAVSTRAREVIGLGSAGFEVGCHTDVLAMKGVDLNDVMSHSSDDRVVIRRGRVISRSRVVHEIVPQF